VIGLNFLELVVCCKEKKKFYLKVKLIWFQNSSFYKILIGKKSLILTFVVPDFHTSSIF